jgi:hypothetical protein
VQEQEHGAKPLCWKDKAFYEVQEFIRKLRGGFYGYTAAWKAVDWGTSCHQKDRDCPIYTIS